ncbi:hypothetical protein [Paenibacillus pini]|uniref:Uncharacterized protein n=1 Tax=Paenibacillus pini JCM 16418 TaxID=1236976 RepID=W7YIZ0_9BACL|nr:hypothetical protein [Paenibacillus pini]GAF10870.1 hypothetical protein JCM16418_5098 [Paenibacillus pini JCM 16418]
MKESKEKLHVVLVRYLEDGGDSFSDSKIKVFPCKSRIASELFEQYYEDNLPKTQLCSIEIAELPIYDF